MWNVVLLRRVHRYLTRRKGGPPVDVKVKFALLVEDLTRDGPRPERWGVTMLKGSHKGKLHCHLNRDWVAVWSVNEGQITITVEEVAARGSASYAE